MGNLVCIGDNFVVLKLKGNNEGVDFYVLQCQFNQPMLSPIILHVYGVMSFRLEIWWLQVSIIINGGMGNIIMCYWEIHKLHTYMHT